MVGRRAEGVGGLPRMAPLHATATRLAAADGDVKRPNEGADDGHIDLELLGGVRAVHGPGAVRAARRQRDADSLMDVARLRPGDATAIARPRLAAGPLGPAGRRSLGERGRLPFRRPVRRVQGSRQPLHVVAQPLTLATEPGVLVLKLGVLSAESLDLVAQLLERLGCRERSLVLSTGLATSHASVMPDS